MRRTLVPALAISVVVALLLVPVLTGRAAFFNRDIHWLWYPTIESLARTVAEGALPLWDPHPSFGQPELAIPNYQVAYPLAWPSLLLPPRAAYSLFVAVHLLVGGLGVTTWLLRLGARRSPAVLAGGIWVLSGPLASFTALHQHLPAVAWLPWVLACLESLLAAPSLAGAAPLGIVLALQALSGSAELPWASAVAATLRVAAGARDGRPLSRVVRSLLLPLAGAVALAVGLAAVQVLPSLELVSRSARLGLDPASRLAWSLHPLSLVDLLSPGFTTEVPLDAEWRNRLFSGREPFLPCLYLGAACLPWALRGLRRRPARPGLLLLAGLLLALGGSTPIYAALSALPPFSSLRYPVKFVAIVALAWAAATGLGFDDWLEDTAGRGRRAPAFTAFGLSLAAVAAATLLPGRLLPFVEPGPLWRTAAFAAAAGILYLARERRQLALGASLAAGLLMLLDCGAVARRGLNLTAAGITSFRPDWVRGLPPHTRLQFRTPLGRRDGLKERPAGTSRAYWWTLGVQQQVLPPLGARWGLDGAYDGDIFGLKPAIAHQVTQALFASWGRPAALRLLQVGAVDYVVSTLDESWLGPADMIVDSIWDPPIRLTRVPDPLPRAHLVDGARILDDPSGLRELMTGEVDVRREVVLDRGAQRLPGDHPAGSARIEARSSDRLLVTVAAERPAWLVLAESYDPGWRATVDGQRAVVRRANLLFRAVEVPAGRHGVELVYRPASARLGALISAATLLGLVAALLVGRRGATRLLFGR